MHDIARRLNAIGTEIGQVVYEREDIIQGALVALVAQQHLLMVGKPGCAKSVLADALIGHISDGRLFKIAMDEYTTADEVLGGLDIKLLSETGRQVRRTAGMMPEAHAVFLDEVFNAIGPTFHSLQTAVNERIFYSEGAAVEIPLLSAMMATNRVNVDQDFAAFWDRVHLRYEVGYLKSRANRTAMVEDALSRMAVGGRRVQIAPKTSVTVTELHTAHHQALSLTWPAKTSEALQEIHEGLAAEGIELSDRRLVECAAAASAAAWLRGHGEVEPRDLTIMNAMAWNLLEQRPKAVSIVMGVADAMLKEALELADQFDDIKNADRSAKGTDRAQRTKQATKTLRDTGALIADIDKALARAQAGTDSERRLTSLKTTVGDYRMKVGMALTSMDTNALMQVWG